MDARRRVSRALLLTLAICLGSAAAGMAKAAPPSQAAASSPAAEAGDPAANLPGPSSIENQAVRRTGTSRSAAGTAAAGSQNRSASSGWWIWGQTVGILGVVLALIGLLFAWLRKTTLGRSFGGSTAAVQILSRGYLTNRHQMVLVRFGGRILLVGVGPQNLQLLSQVDDPAEAAQLLARLEGSKSGSLSRDFQQAIDAAAGEYDPISRTGPEGQGPSPLGEPRIGTLRNDLRGLLAKMQSLGRKPPE